MRTQNFFFLYPALVTRRKTFFSMSLPSLKLAISVILIVILVSQTMQIIDISIWEGKCVLLITCSANLVSLLFLPIGLFVEPKFSKAFICQ